MYDYHVVYIQENKGGTGMYSCSVTSGERITKDNLSTIVDGIKKECSSENVVILNIIPFHNL